MYFIHVPHVAAIQARLSRDRSEHAVILSVTYAVSSSCDADCWFQFRRSWKRTVQRYCGLTTRRVTRRHTTPVWAASAPSSSSSWIPTVLTMSRVPMLSGNIQSTGLVLVDTSALSTFFYRSADIFTGFPCLLESSGKSWIFFLENSRTWTVLENHFGPGKS